MNNQDMIELLRLELQRRIAKNPCYSLRSFAMYLEVDASHLSRLLQRKRKLSHSLAQKICERLDWDMALASPFKPVYSWDQPAASLPTGREVRMSVKCDQSTLDRIKEILRQEAPEAVVEFA